MGCVSGGDELRMAGEGGRRQLFWRGAKRELSRSIDVDNDGAGSGVYEYRVRACVASGCGIWSAALTVTLNQITAPTNLRNTAADSANRTGTIKMAWTGSMTGGDAL